MNKKLLAFCRYFKGEKTNPFEPKVNDLMTELRFHYWNYERIFVNNYEENALFSFNNHNKIEEIDPGDFTEEDVFKYWIKEALIKCTPSDYEPFETYFSNKLIRAK